MRITLEADYALRIMCLLANSDELVDAGTIAEDASVPSRFALKILRKLTQGGLVKSYKGKNGGYKILEDPAKCTLLRVIELIDGPLVISRCGDIEGGCGLVSKRTGECAIHHIFEEISNGVSNALSKITIAEVADKNANIFELTKKLHI